MEITSIYVVCDNVIRVKNDIRTRMLNVPGTYPKYSRNCYIHGDMWRYNAII